MLKIFSFGYYGWGTRTAELVSTVDAEEMRRGFQPPLWVDIRKHRQVRAEGFVGNAFRQLVGPARYKWMRRLGNEEFDDRGGAITIADPTAARELLTMPLRGEAERKRLVFFCGCQFPCHE